MGSATTSGGSYLFSSLANGSYIVTVSDQHSALVGYKWTDGVDNQNNESQVPTYAVSINNASIDYADFGFFRPDGSPPSVPTSVALASFTATAVPAGIRVRWETGSELGNLGFDLYRERAEGAPQRVKLNGALIPANRLGALVGARYEFLDGTAAPGTAYSYWLQDYGANGRSTMHGPVMAAMPAQANRRPANVSVTPDAATSRPWSWTEFVVTYGDADGIEDLRYVEVLINERASGARGIWLRYFPANGKLLLRNPDTRRWLRVKNGRGQNPYAIIELVDVSQGGELLQITYRLKAKGTFAGDWNLYLRAVDRGGLRDGWEDMGDWRVAR